MDFGPLITEGTVTETEWNTTEEKIQQDSLSAPGAEAAHTITRSEYRTGQNKNR